MGAAGMVGLFASIVFHELSHSLVARRHGIEIKGITLFIFGGVAEMEDEPPDPKSEFAMAIAGPIASYGLCAALYGTTAIGIALDWPVPMVAVFRYVAYMNGILATFNLVPAFPLDGGRVLRSILWAWKSNIRWATRVTSQMGAAFGMVLIMLGVFSILLGMFLPGLWWCLIGLFLRSAAQMSYQQLVIRKALEGEPIRRFMSVNPVTIPPSISIETFVEDFVYHYHHKMFPVIADSRLLGCVTTTQVKEVLRDEWPQRAVAELVCESSDENTIDVNADATKALATMSRSGNGRLMVVDQGRLVGIISLKDLLKFIEIKVDLEGAE
jgi:Zn-dependent protease